jgi:hypothetical protein
MRIGHSILALAAAFLGGHVSRWLYLRGNRATHEQAQTST